jgi:hypothetical protein
VPEMTWPHPVSTAARRIASAALPACRLVMFPGY